MADDDDKIPDYEMSMSDVHEQTWEGRHRNIHIKMGSGQQFGRDASGGATSTSWKFFQCRETSLLHPSPSSESDAASPLADWDEMDAGKDEGPDEYDEYSIDPDEARFGPDEGDARFYFGKDEGPDEHGIDRSGPSSDDGPDEEADRPGRRLYGKDEGPDEYGIDRMKERHQRQDDAFVGDTTERPMPKGSVGTAFMEGCELSLIHI